MPPSGSVRVETTRDADSSIEEAGKPVVRLGKAGVTRSVIVPVGEPESEGEVEPDPSSDGEMEPESVPVGATESEPGPEPSPDWDAKTEEVKAPESVSIPAVEPEPKVNPEPEPEPSSDGDIVVMSGREPLPEPDAESVTDDTSSETEPLGVCMSTSSVNVKAGSVTRSSVVATPTKEGTLDVGTKSSVNAVSLLTPDGDAEGDTEEDEPRNGS